jgi:hypothetical protein
LYRQLGDLVGTPEARELAVQLTAWHDAMVRHVRITNSRGAGTCGDGCPHDEAATLWTAALTMFGERATTLAFLRRHGSRGVRPSGFGSDLREARL